MLIAVHQELSRRADLRRQRADAAGATLMTTASSLSAALIAGASLIDDVDQVPQWAVYLTLGELLVALLLGGASRAGRSRRLFPITTRGTRAWSGRTGGTQRTPKDCRQRLSQDRQSDPEELAPSYAASQLVLRLWSVRADIGDVSVELKYRLLALGGASLAIAIAALVVIGVSVLSGVWPDNGGP